MRRWAWALTGASASFTFAININQASVVAPIIRKIFDRTANAINGVASGVTAALPIAGCKNITAKIVLGAAATPATYQIQVSDDGVNWSPVGTATVAVANATTTLVAPAGVIADFARVAVTSAGTTQTGTYIVIQASS